MPLRQPWLPNALTALRLLLVPAFVVLAVEVSAADAAAGPTRALRSAAMGVLLLSGATDVLDGFLARRWNLITPFGALADAVADKLTQVSALTALTWIGAPAFTPLPFTLLGAVLLRDLVLGVGWLALKRRGASVSVEHELHGRLATVLVFLVVLATTADAPAAWVLPAVAVASLAALVSAGGYSWRAIRRLAEDPSSIDREAGVP